MCRPAPDASPDPPDAPHPADLAAEGAGDGPEMPQEIFGVLVRSGSWPDGQLLRWFGPRNPPAVVLSVSREAADAIRVRTAAYKCEISGLRPMTTEVVCIGVAPSWKARATQAEADLDKLMSALIFTTDQADDYEEGDPVEWRLTLDLPEDPTFEDFPTRAEAVAALREHYGLGAKGKGGC
jgi:hypothetical protein